MKTIIIFFFGITFTLMGYSQVFKTVNVTAGQLSSAISVSELTTVTNLTISGTIDARDFKTLRDKMTKLAVLDLSVVNISSYTGTEGTASTSSTQYLANELPAYAFNTKQFLTSIALPSSITTIRRYAFYNCYKLSSITIPSSVTTIESHAFYWCSALSTVTIPSSVINIGESSFGGSGLTSVIIPSSVKSIGSSAFTRCANLATVNILANITTIESSTFDQCINLASVNIPSSVTSIGSWAFESCTSLTSINIPTSVLTIGLSAFRNCMGPLIVAANNPNYSSNNGLLFSKNQTSLIQCPISKTGSYSIPSTVNSIELGAFEKCVGLTSVIVPSSVTSIKGSAFANCVNLVSVNIPSSVKDIGMSAFEYCISLASVNIPSSVTSIGMWAFNGCSGLVSVDANNPNYSSIDGVLFNKTQTALLHCPISKTGDYTIPSSATSLEYLAFNGCTLLRKITIPSSVTSISGSVFRDCSGLTSIYTKATIPVNLSDSYSVFYKVNFATCKLYVPEGSIRAYQGANQWKDFQNIEEFSSVDLPNGLVASYPFNGNANDESGYENNGTVYGATPIMDRFGNSNSAFWFNGISDYIKVPDDETLDIVSQISIVGWLKKDANVSWASMVTKGGEFGLENNYALHNSVNNGVIFTGNSQGNCISSISIPLNEWHFVALTWNGDSAKIYIDGKADRVSNVKLKGILTLNNSNLYIGADFPGTVEYFKGSLDDIRIYNRAINQSEVNALYSEYDDLQLKAIFSSNQTKSCNNLLAQLKDNSTGNPTSWSWDFGDGTTSSNQHPEHYYSHLGNYDVTLIVNDSDGNKDTLIQKDFIKIYKPPVTYVTPDTTICACTKLDLVAYGGIGYRWSTGETKDRITVSPAKNTVYYVTIIGEGCDVLDSVQVKLLIPSEKPKLIVENNRKILCPSEIVMLSTNSSGNYLWNTGETSNSIKVDKAGAYFVRVKDQNQCYAYSDTVDFELDTPIKIQLLDNPSTLCKGDKITLSFTGKAQTYGWSNGMTNDTIVLHPDLSQNINLTATSLQGCCNNDFIHITVLDTVGELAGPANLFPSDEKKLASRQVEFSWNPVKNASTYDLFIWEGSIPPSVPSFPNLEGIKTKHSLNFGTTYHWKVAAKNSCQYAESGVQTFFISNLPDLIVDTIIAPDEVFADETFEVKWRIKNAGKETTNVPAWIDRLFLTPDMEIRIGEPEDWLIVQKENPMMLEPGQYYEQKVKFKISGNKIGTQFLGIVTDLADALFINWEKMEVWAHGGNVLPEGNDWNNFLFKEIKIKVPQTPDLILQNIGHGVSCFSNTTIPLTYELTNQGEVHLLKTRWVDRIYISTNQELDNSARLIGNHRHEQGIPIDSILKINTTVQIPLDIYGDCYVYVVADADNSIPEYNFEGNNTKQSEKVIRVTLSPTPDLVPFDITIPSVMLRGNNTIEYSVKNQGFATTNAQQWIDEVQICSDVSFAENNTECIIRNTLQKPVKSGETYFLRSNWVIPDYLHGEFYVRVDIDASNTIFEYNKEANNFYVQKVTIPEALTPDMHFVSGKFSQPELIAGNTYSFDYTVENIGNKALQNKLLQDAFMLQTSNSQMVGSVKVGDYQQYISLGINASLKRTVNINIPANLSGEFNFIASTNASNKIYENNYSNNTNTIKVNILAKPVLQFQLSNLQAPNQVPACSTAKLSWTVINRGESKALEGEWSDKVYLSSTSKVDKSAILLKTITYNDDFQTGKTYQGTGSVQIPGGLAGNYFFVLANSSGSGNNNRTITLSAQVKITPIDYPDLKVDDIVSENKGKSGQPHTLSFTISNIGHGDTPFPKWVDGIYISSDKIVDNQDEKLLDFRHDGVLKANDQYQTTVPVDLPSYLLGDYFLLVQADDDDQLYDGNPYNNVAAQQITLEPTSLVDIAVTQVEAPSEIEPERNAEVSYTLGNAGEKEISYWVTNGLFLSKDTVWDIDDYSANHHKQHLQIPSGQQQTISNQHLSPVLQPGDYHYIVKANQTKSAFELNWENNTKTSATTTQLTVEPLEIDVSRQISLSKIQNKYLVLTLPEGETIEIRIESNDNNAINSIYASYDRLPEKSLYDFMANNQSNSPVLTIPESKAGKYYLLISNEDCLGTTSLNITAKVIPFEITSVNDSRGGNNSDISFEVCGSKFAPNMDVRLERHGQFMAADGLYYKDPTSMMATFNLDSAEIGEYDVVAELPNGEITKLEKGFTVETAKVPELGSFMNGPQTVRRERKFAIEIAYWNNGNNNLKVNGLVVQSKGGSPIALKIEELDSLYSELYIPIKEPKTDPGILRPGYRGVQTIYCYSTKEVSISLSAIMPKKQD